MKILTAEMKAELAAKKTAAEANAKIRAGRSRPKPVFKSPDNRTAIIVPEREEDPHKRANPVSSWYWEYEDQGIVQSDEPVYRKRI